MPRARCQLRVQTYRSDLQFWTKETLRKSTESSCQPGVTHVPSRSALQRNTAASMAWHHRSLWVLTSFIGFLKRMLCKMIILIILWYSHVNVVDIIVYIIFSNQGWKRPTVAKKYSEWEPREFTMSNRQTRSTCLGRLLGRGPWYLTTPVHEATNTLHINSTKPLCPQHNIKWIRMCCTEVVIWT